MLHLISNGTETERNKMLNKEQAEQQQLLAAAKDIIAGGTLETLDPLLGDQACHVRAYALVSLIKNLNLTGEENPEDVLGQLTIPQQQFLMTCRMMSHVRTLPEIDSHGLLIKNERTDETKLPLDSGKKAKSTASKEYRKICSEYAITATTSLMDPEIGSVVCDGKRKLFRQDPHEEIKVLPLYLTCLGMFQSTITNATPILITIKRIAPNHDCSAITKAEDLTTLLIPDGNGLKVASDGEARRLFRQPALHIYLNTIDHDGLNAQQYLKKYFSTSILDLLLASAVFHEQYPRLADDQETTCDFGKYSEKYNSSKAFGTSIGIVEDCRVYEYGTGRLRSELLQGGMPPQIDHICAAIITARVIDGLTTLESSPRSTSYSSQTVSNVGGMSCTTQHIAI
jgi:hypothetical protein